MVGDNESVVRFVSDAAKVRKELRTKTDEDFKTYAVPVFGAIRIPLRDEYAIDDWLDILEDFIAKMRKLRETRNLDEPLLMMNIHRLLRFTSDRCMATPLRNQVDESDNTE